MNVVYILQLNNGEYYLGSTNNLERRLMEHNSGKTISIRHKLPARIIFQQEFETLTQARSIELKLKKFKSKKYLSKL